MNLFQLWSHHTANKNAQKGNKYMEKDAAEYESHNWRDEEVIVWLKDALTFQFETVRKCHSTYWVLSSINDICIDITAKRLGK